MFLYRVLSLLALVAYSPYAVIRSLAGRRRLGDIRGRLGWRHYPDLSGGIWVHAVSVGEVGVARQLFAALARKAPGVVRGLSVTTAAGRELAERDTEGGTLVFSFPFDLARPVEKALAEVRPGLVLLTETELWPLFLDRAFRRGIPVAVVNGRISSRSMRRYALARRFLARTLEKVSLFAMQTGEDAERIVRLGAPREKIRVTGNIKYDLSPAPPFADAARLAKAAAGRPIVVAASTGEGEEEIVLEAWQGLVDRALLAIAPRRPERFEKVARLVEERGLRLLRRSEAESRIQNPKSKIDVYLLDTIGELRSLYREAFIAFLGGSLVAAGGHNPIEAWAEGVPVLVGSDTENFKEVSLSGERSGLLHRVRNAGELAQRLSAALADPERTAAAGTRARRFVADNRGAAEATVELVLPLLASGSARRAAAK